METTVPCVAEKTAEKTKFWRRTRHVGAPIGILIHKHEKPVPLGFTELPHIRSWLFRGRLPSLLSLTSASAAAASYSCVSGRERLLCECFKRVVVFKRRREGTDGSLISKLEMWMINTSEHSCLPGERRETNSSVLHTCVLMCACRTASGPGRRRRANDICSSLLRHRDE